VVRCCRILQFGSKLAWVRDAGPDLMQIKMAMRSARHEKGEKEEKEFRS
jgi:hypothetical protein